MTSKTTTFALRPQDNQLVASQNSVLSQLTDQVSALQSENKQIFVCLNKLTTLFEAHAASTKSP